VTARCGTGARGEGKKGARVREGREREKDEGREGGRKRENARAKVGGKRMLRRESGALE